MKQRITQEQLDALTAQEKIKLADWASPLDTLSWRRTPTGHILKAHLPLLTIGEMIWFLDKHGDPDVDAGRYTERYSAHDGGVIHKGCVLSGQPLWYVGMHRAPELCDALWEAVRDVLRKQTEEQL